VVQCWSWSVVWAAPEGEIFYNKNKIIDLGYCPLLSGRAFLVERNRQGKNRLRKKYTHVLSMCSIKSKTITINGATLKENFEIILSCWNVGNFWSGNVQCR